MTEDDSLFRKISSQFSQGWKLLIQPQRIEYTMEDLGMQVQILNGCKYVRHDFSVGNKKGKRIECSYYEPSELIKMQGSSAYGTHGDLTTKGSSNDDFSDLSNGLSGISGNSGFGGNDLKTKAEDWTFGNLKKRPLLIYLHSQTGCKIEGRHLLRFCAKKHIGLLLYDSIGCGRSEGEYVSLGYFEHLDLANIITEIRKRFMIGPISLWGRSMGAVTSILYCEKNPTEINSLVLDSPFADLQEMVKEIGSTQFKMPGMIMNVVIKMFSGIIKKRLGVDIFKLKPGIQAQKVEVPAFFIVGKNDKLLPKQCVMDIYKKYKAKKKVIVHSTANHSEEREQHIIAGAFDHICDEISKTVYKGLSAIEVKKERRGKHTKGGDFFDPFFNPKPSSRVNNQPRSKNIDKRNQRASIISHLSSNNSSSQITSLVGNRMNSSVQRPSSQISSQLNTARGVPLMKQHSNNVETQSHPLKKLDSIEVEQNNHSFNRIHSKDVFHPSHNINKLKYKKARSGKIFNDENPDEKAFIEQQQKNRNLLRARGQTDSLLNQRNELIDFKVVDDNQSKRSNGLLAFGGNNYQQKRSRKVGNPLNSNRMISSKLNFNKGNQNNRAPSSTRNILQNNFDSLRNQRVNTLPNQGGNFNVDPTLSMDQSKGRFKASHGFISPNKPFLGSNRKHFDSLNAHEFHNQFLEKQLKADGSTQQNVLDSDFDTLPDKMEVPRENIPIDNLKMKNLMNPGQEGGINSLNPNKKDTGSNKIFNKNSFLNQSSSMVNTYSKRHINNIKSIDFNSGKNNLASMQEYSSAQKPMLRNEDRQFNPTDSQSSAVNQSNNFGIRKQLEFSSSKNQLAGAQEQKTRGYMNFKQKKSKKLSNKPPLANGVKKRSPSISNSMVNPFQSMNSNMNNSREAEGEGIEGNYYNKSYGLQVNNSNLNPSSSTNYKKKSYDVGSLMDKFKNRNNAVGDNKSSQNNASLDQRTKNLKSKVFGAKKSRSFLGKGRNISSSRAIQGRSTSRDSTSQLTSVNRFRSNRDMPMNSSTAGNPLNMLPEFKFGQGKPYRSNRMNSSNFDPSLSQNNFASIMSNKANQRQGKMESYINSFKNKLNNSKLRQNQRNVQNNNQNMGTQRTHGGSFNNSQVPNFGNPNNSQMGQAQNSNQGSFLNNVGVLNTNHNNSSMLQNFNHQTSVYQSGIMASQNSPRRGNAQNINMSGVQNSQAFYAGQNSSPQQPMSSRQRGSNGASLNDPSKYRHSIQVNSFQKTQFDSAAQNQGQNIRNAYNGSFVSNNSQNTSQSGFNQKQTRSSFQQMDPSNLYYAQEPTQAKNYKAVNNIRSSRQMGLGGSKNPLARRLSQSKIRK